MLTRVKIIHVNALWIFINVWIAHEFNFIHIRPLIDCVLVLVSWRVYLICSHNNQNLPPSFFVGHKSQLEALLLNHISRRHNPISKSKVVSCSEDLIVAAFCNRLAWDFRTGNMRGKFSSYAYSLKENNFSALNRRPTWE